MAAALAPNQAKFAGTLARETGLNPRVIGSWLLAEQSGSAAKYYEGKGYNNWLNIANTDSGPAKGAHSSAWGNPESAAKATAAWLKGEGQIAKEYGQPAIGIKDILHTAGQGPVQQIQAISHSGWASSGYDGGSILHSLYNEIGAGQIPETAPAAKTASASAAGVPGAKEAPAEPTSKFNQAAFKEASTASTIGKLYSPAERANNPLFTTGALTTREPSRAEYTETTPAVPKLPGQPAAKESAAPGKLPSSAPESAEGVTKAKGIVDFNGKQVAAWIAPILKYVESKGVKPEITSGYRSKADQERIYNSGVRPAAVPGTSNHEGDEFPRGAVDLGNAEAVAKVLANSPYKNVLVYAGSKDPVHFSHPHNGGY